MEHPSLVELLERAAPGGPASLRPAQAGGDALALALHCRDLPQLRQGLMVNDGYVALDRARGGPADWNAVDNIWAWDYIRPGAARRFRLQCSVQPVTRRMFVHASEAGPSGEPTNINVMGLQVSNYVHLPDSSDTQATSSGSNSGRSSGSSSWQGVIASEATLASMWRKFVAAPLWGHAEKLPAGSSGSASTSSASWQEQSRALAQALHQRRHVLLPAAAAVAAVAAGMLIWRRRASSM